MNAVTGRGRVATDPRLRRRRLAVERMRRRRTMVTLTAATALGTVLWAAFWSPLLSVREVRVLGGRHTTSGEIAEAAGLSRDDNLLLVSTGDVARRTETLPWVRRAMVDRKLPGTVRVRVVERRPVFLLRTSRGRWTLDGHGRVLARGAAARGLPVLSGVPVAGLAPGHDVRAGGAIDALAAWRRLPGAVRKRVAGVVATTVERISLSLNDGTVVRYGAAENLRAKNEVLVSLLARLRREGRLAAYIDVRVAANPAVGQRPPRS